MISTPSRRLFAALASGVLVAVVGYFANALAFFVGNQLSIATLALGLSEFAYCAVIAAALVALGAYLGIFTRWWVAAICGLLVGLISALLGVAILFLTQGGAQADSVLPIISSLVNFTLIFWVAIAVATPTVGRRMYWLILDYRDPRAQPVALVRIPSSRLANGIVTHIPRTPVDTALADKQWDAYVAALAGHGWSTVEVGPLEASADSVFIEDTAVTVGDVAVITRSGAESRRGEVDAVETNLDGRGFQIERIEEPATLDGGDVLVIGPTVFVGRSTRTNAEGIRQLRAILAGRLTALGQPITVVAVPIRAALHLKTAASALPDGTVLAATGLLEDPSVFGRFLPVPENEGAAVVALDESTVLVSAAAPATAALVRDLGYEVVELDISEFEKLEGGLTCLSIRLRPGA